MKLSKINKLINIQKELDEMKAKFPDYNCYDTRLWTSTTSSGGSY
jgi:hypothetical protein